MADIRFDNMFWSPGGFNIQSGEPIDSRMYVTDIKHIYSADNWKKVKPYPGLIVSAPDGEVRICVNDDYTLESSWKKIGGGAVSVPTYKEAVDLATLDNVGQVIYVSTKSEYDADGEGEGAAKEYAAAPYIVTGNGSLMKLAASSAADDVTSDVAELQTRVGNLEGDITRIDADIATKANTADVEKAIEDLDSTIEQTYLSQSSASSTYLSQTDAEATYVAQTTYEAKVQEIGTTTEGLRTDVDALKTSVGVQAVGEVPATGLYKEIEDLKSDITAIPKFDIKPVNNIDEIPVEKISESTVYLVKDKDSERDLYTEYIYVEGKWENLGKQTVDLNGYSDTNAMNQAISDAIEALKIGDYYKKTEVDNLLNDKADASALNAYVLSSTLESDYLTKAVIETELGKKADDSKLNSYVDTFNAELDKKADVSKLSDYVDNTSYGNDKTALEAAIAKKADESVLGDYLKIADIDTNLTTLTYVKQDYVTNELKNYVLSTDLENTLKDYVLATALKSSSIALVDGVYEVNTISEKELNEIISSNVSE